METKTIDKMTIREIASLIGSDWKDIYFGALPYLNAMLSLQSVKDNYGADDGRSIVAYFLSNATRWKGDTARMVKKELNKRIKSR